MSAGIHHAAADGFGSQAAAYARGRPDYPQALAGWLRDEIGLGAGRRVLDLGAGTGKFSGLLAASGATVVAVEPVEAMRAQLAARLPQVDVQAGTAEAIPLADASCDLVACAQAFHWFATPPALAEIRRVLKPGGELLLVWNVRDESVDWVAALTELMTPYEGDTPRFHSGAWRSVFPAEGFGPLAETAFDYVHAGPAEQVVVDRVLSVSFIAALPDAERERVAERLRALVAGHPALAGRAEVRFPYRTLAYRARRLD
ncbi:class I SAM-dependent methyltransferase [Chitinimonas koreensis]|uniref:class I SAM-dependent methyltransferase n=1 Tax=Chitinimonas koreensis TaxID=356302 RepID=UPI000423562B|nr:class I SAM-dependent methyltransferase [Chitinimonas koreensis]QNM96836.1 methyltransferase domain-containing protein [Chitinimonas koreensis]